MATTRTSMESISAIQTIGETAGRVWSVLDKQGPLRLSTLQRRVDAPAPVLCMALGWLAREDKVEVTVDGRSFMVRLR